MTKDDRIDPAAGITLVRKTGDSVKKGEPIARLHSNLAADRVDAAEERFRSALTFSQSAPPHRPLLLGMLE